VCAAIAVAVFAMMLASIITFRTSLRDCPWTSVSSKATEILWALIPIAIVLATAMPALRMIVLADGRGGSWHSSHQFIVFAERPHGSESRISNDRA
jgi:heme/copper-type cytochrome/quinol oxidase subunit 2